jgi:phage/plasmid-like protein (TIGR03299 family)
MSHEFESGFMVREPAWHGLGNVLATAPESWDEARVLSGLTWEPELRPLYFLDEDGTFVEETNARRVIRNDKPARESGMGTVSDTFELITHEEMGQMVEPLFDQEGTELITMGSLKGGRTVWALFRLNEPYEIKGDIDGFGDAVLSLPYFGIMNSHDGSGACKGQFSQIRWVCANTVQAGALEGDRHGAQFSLRHTSGVKERIDEARSIVEMCRKEASAWRATAEALAQIPFTDEQQVEFLDRWIPVPHVDGLHSDVVRRNAENDRARFLHILRVSPTNSEMQHTGLGVMNAAVEFADHLRGFRSKETYLSRQILRPEPLKAKALAMVHAVAGK